MAVGLRELAQLPPVAGLRVGTAAAGIKKAGRRDLVVFELAPGSRAAAVFTRNAFCAAPVIVARRHLQTGAPKYLVVNTGNANAGTGEPGVRDAQAVCAALAELAGCKASQVLPFSTGVIGEPLPVERIIAGLPAALAARSADAWVDAAHGIMTTDTVPKGASRRITLDGRAVTVTGIAKGAGMIRPDMATMLAFVATDAAVDSSVLQSGLAAAVERSFNRITVDGDTSTNDACVLIATGCAGNPEIVAAQGEAYGTLVQAVEEVCVELAQAIVRDGEGATKLITVSVEQGASNEECLQVAYAVAHSPLVKTAFYASDPNWGRILAAVGRAGVLGLEVDRVSIHLDEVCIVERGGRATTYHEAAGREVMAREDITVRILLGRGVSAERVWTCDFSYDYVKINAEYRT